MGSSQVHDGLGLALRAGIGRRTVEVRHDVREA
jgi:hypothetical protein